MKVIARIKAWLSASWKRICKKDKRTIVAMERGNLPDGTSMMFFDCSDRFDTGGK